MNQMRRLLNKIYYGVLRKIKKAIRYFNRSEEYKLHRMLYDLVHDKDESLDLSAARTVESFSKQWGEYKEGKGLLTDPFFKENVDSFLSEEELLISKDWFKGKDVLDAGCGNGRWSYGFAKLGANITSVDINEVAIEETKKNTEEFDVNKTFIRSSLEGILPELEPRKQFDLVFSWGVIHHANSYTKSLNNLLKLVKPGGFIYLYLYGRESLPYDKDIKMFKDRLYYNFSLSEEEKYKYLLERVDGDRSKVHNAHDVLAPLINRRLDFNEVKEQLESNGFCNVTRTIDATEIFVRAEHGPISDQDKQMLLEKKSPPYWFHKL